MNNRIYFPFILAILTTKYVFAVGGPISSANEQLRHIFSLVNHPTNFLYDRAAHMMNEQYFSTQYDRAITPHIWYYVYEEMYNCAIDQSNLYTSDEVYEIAQSRGIDTIPIALLNVKYAKLGSNALNSNNYYDFDTIRNLLIPNSSISHFDVREIFSAAISTDMTRTLSPTFCIGELFFTDQETLSLMQDPNIHFRIDFDDGTGYHTFDVDAIQYYTARYSNIGVYTLQVIVDSPDGILKKSKSTIIVTATNIVDEEEYLLSQQVTSTKIDDVSGLETYEYASDCSDRMPSNREKIVFILAGYDPLSFQQFKRRNSAELYQKYVVDAHLSSLLVYGYKFVIVDWEDPNADIIENAELFIQLLNHYMCTYAHEEPYVVIGNSMGSLIARYALAKLEQDRLVCAPEKVHNTRLYISNDGPHQGVNIPMSLQLLYSDLLDGGLLYDLTDFLNAITRSRINFSTTLLHGVSVKQMLNRHYETGRGTGVFTAAPERLNFLQNLENIGYFPRYCKTIALSNGNLLGKKQQNIFRNSQNAYEDIGSTPREPNDHILYIDNQLLFYILGLRFTHELSLDFRTNPDGFGLLSQISKITSQPRIKLKWFHIEISRNISEERESYYGDGLKPYCIMSGGNEFLTRTASKPFPFFDLSFLGIDTNIPTPGYVLTVGSGVPWLFGMSDQLVLYSDGLGFGFVPLCSALDIDYENVGFYNEQSVDLSTENVERIMSNTPFDIIVGKSSTQGILNENHENTLNAEIIKRNGAGWTFIRSNYTGLTKKFLNEEIGEENLYLNKFDIESEFVISTIDSIFINKESPYTISHGYPLSGNHTDSLLHISALSKSTFVNADDYNFVAFCNDGVYFENNEPLFEYWGGGYDGELCVSPEYRVSQQKLTYPLLNQDSSNFTIGYSDNKIRITTDHLESIQDVSIFTMWGTILNNLAYKTDEHSLFVPFLPPNGIYFVVVTTRDCIVTKKIIKL